MEVVMVKSGMYFVWQGGTEAVVRFTTTGKPTVTVNGRDLPHCGRRGATARRRRQILAAVRGFLGSKREWVVCINCDAIIYPEPGSPLESRALGWGMNHLSAMAISPEECPICRAEAERREKEFLMWERMWN
jgi:hypothetical protein